MGSSNIRDLLTAFSPCWDFFAICSGGGRIKIWDTLKGQVQTEFADINSSDSTGLYFKSETGHLSLDYSCMEWLPLERKKKKKFGHSLLVLGTGSGDVLALDVASGQLKWRVSDCHPGSVNAITFSAHSSGIYTAGVDGMVCQIDHTTGSLLRKFKASSKAISSMAISSDGKMLATAAGQLKIFNCSDNKKMQKFSGHPGGVRCMMFTEDCNYVLSSATGERYVVVWKIDGRKKQSASCVLAMEHPAVFLHSKCADKKDKVDVGLYVLAISESGICYFWYGKNIEDLRDCRPTKISLSSEGYPSMNRKNVLPMIFAAEIQGIVRPGSGQVFAAYGSLIKPSFEKIIIEYGEDIMLKSTQDGVLLPMGQKDKSQRDQLVHNRVTALDRANVEDALLPVPKLHESHGKKRRHSVDPEEDPAYALTEQSKQTVQMDTKEDQEIQEDDVAATCIEERLKSVGILCNKEEPNMENYPKIPNISTLSSTLLNEAPFGENIPPKKLSRIKAAIKDLTSRDAYKLLKGLINIWKSRSGSGKFVLPWIFNILVCHSHYLMSREPSSGVLDSLCKMIESRHLAVQPLLQLVGRMQLIIAQIDKAGQKNTRTLSRNEEFSQSESEEDDDVDELVFGEEDESISGSDDDN